MPCKTIPSMARGEMVYKRRMETLSGSANSGAGETDSKIGTTAMETKIEASRKSWLVMPLSKPPDIWPSPSPPIVMII